jgi:hypothetical protein
MMSDAITSPFTNFMAPSIRRVEDTLSARRNNVVISSKVGKAAILSASPT